jgi:rod shape-determining protein MreD
MTPLKRKWLLAWWQAVPAVTLLAALLLAVPLEQLHALPVATAALPLLALAYWTLTRPQHLRYRAVIGIGIVADILTGLPLGLTPLIWCAFRYLALRVRKDVHDEGFVVAWLLTSVLLLAALLAQWLLMSLWRGDTMPASAIVGGWAVAVLLYPLAHTALGIVERSFHRRYWFMMRG